MKLFHFSEDPAIEVFAPRWHERQERALVWAIDEEHSPLYWFPRDCPRCTWWSDSEPRIHATEWAWYERMRDCLLYAYVLPPETFEPMGDESGYWISPDPITPLACEEVGQLIERHRDAGIELRFMTDVWPLWDEVVGSGRYQFSGCRLDNTGVQRDWRS